VLVSRRVRLPAQNLIAWADKDEQPDPEATDDRSVRRLVAPGSDITDALV
jgi:hypothetical protein